jgi:uncharacterized protein YkwD
MKKRLVTITGFLVAAFLLSAAPTVHASSGKLKPARAAQACVGKDAIPTAATLNRASRATLCLLNAQRSAHGLRKVTVNRTLGRSATRYAKRMVSQRFFSHTAPNGGTLKGRMRAYISGTSGWAFGENLAWGSGVRATPAQIMRAWMASPGHRQNILSARWKHIGIGIAPGAPVAGVRGPAASYVTHFGWRG